MLNLLLLLALGQAQPQFDACRLLSDADVKRVLDLTVAERHPGSADARGLLLFQCYLGTGTGRSISVAVAGPAKTPGRTVTPARFWREQFHRDAGDERTGAESAPERRGDEREGEAEARRISGIGDEAFWSGTRVAGALYVLQGDTFIRVSVGGIADERERIEKSRQLAAAALSRLPRPAAPRTR